MDKVFVSSVMRDFAAERQAASDAVESLGLRPVMAETAPASADPSRTALLGRVGECDAVVLLLPNRYGDVTASGFSPTEDEFREAVRLSKPILVFVQDGVTREPAQDEFIARVRGSWESGWLTASFATPAQLSLAIVRALDELRTQLAGGDALPAAAARARELVVGSRRHSSTSGAALRVACVPVGVGTLLNAHALDDAGLVNAVIAAARATGVLSQSVGVDSGVSAAGVELTAQGRDHGDRTTVVFAEDGAVCVEFGANASGNLGSMAISHPRVADAIAAIAALSEQLWTNVPGGDRVRQICAAIGIPEAGYTIYSMSGETGGGMTMGSVASPVVAPDPAIALRRNDLTSDRLVAELTVPLRRVFADANSLRS